jgi:hypothetical protein
MPVTEAAAIRIISTIAGMVTCCVLRKMLSLPASRVRGNDGDVCTVYMHLMVYSQAYHSSAEGARSLSEVAACWHMPRVSPLERRSGDE